MAFYIVLVFVLVHLMQKICLRSDPCRMGR